MFKKLNFVFLAALLIFPLSTAAWGGAMVKVSSVPKNIESKTGEKQSKKFVLDDGLTVLVSEMPSSTTVSVFALVKTGSALEGKYAGTGISHFMEHMLFKGTDKRGVGQISKEVQALGGEINATTSFDYTIYTLTLPSSAFDNGLDIISDMLMHSKFDHEQIEKEREVVYGEMRLYKDNPDRALGQMVFNTVYKQHPYGIPVIGYEDLLRSLNRDDFVDYYKSKYIPSNIIISVAGHVKADEILPKIRETFKDFSRKPIIARNLVPEPVQINMRSSVDEYPTDLTRVSLAYSGVSTRDPDLYAMDVLAMLLGQGQSSRLFKEVYLNKKLVRSIDATDFTPMDRGFFEIEMLLDESNIDAAVNAVKKEIALISQNGVPAAELEKIKRQILTQHVFGRLTSDAVAESVATDEAFLGDEEFSRKYVQAVKDLKPEDIKRVAQKYLVEQNLSQCVLKPKKNISAAVDAKNDEKTLKIQKVVLDNGLTVLLRENHASPIVSINLVMNGGTWQENAETNGICELTSRLLVSGTKTRTSEQIAQSIESRGAGLSPFSGRNSFGLSFNLLSEDTPFALDLLEDMLKNSNFPEKELARQKQDVMTALISQEDNISVVTSRNLRESLFQKHPFRLDSLGNLKSVEKITQGDVVNFYKQYVVPNNMVISIFGDFDPQSILEDLKRKFGGLAKSDIHLNTFSENPPDATRENTIRLNKKQAMVMIGFQGVAIKNKDRYAMQVLSSILGSPFSGRIFNTVRDEFGQAYTLGGGYTPSRDMGMMSFYVQTTDDHVEKVKDILERLIVDIQKNPVGDAELKDMKTYMKGSYQMGLQLDSSIGFTAALDELYGLGYDNYQSLDKNIDSVTAEDIKRLAEQYLDLKKAAIVIARPTAEALNNPALKLPVRLPTGPTDIH